MSTNNNDNNTNALALAAMKTKKASLQEEKTKLELDRVKYWYHPDTVPVEEEMLRLEFSNIMGVELCGDGTFTIEDDCKLSDKEKLVIGKQQAFYAKKADYEILGKEMEALQEEIDHLNDEIAVLETAATDSSAEEVNVIADADPPAHPVTANRTNSPVFQFGSIFVCDNEDEEHEDEAYMTEVFRPGSIFEINEENQADDLSLPAFFQT